MLYLCHVYQEIGLKNVRVWYMYGMFYSLRGIWHPNIQHSPVENLGCKISNQSPMKSLFHRLVYKLQKMSKSWDLQVPLTSHLDQRYLTRKVIDRHHLELIT